MTSTIRSPTPFSWTVAIFIAILGIAYSVGVAWVTADYVADQNVVQRERSVREARGKMAARLAPPKARAAARHEDGTPCPCAP